MLYLRGLKSLYCEGKQKGRGKIMEARRIKIEIINL